MNRTILFVFLSVATFMGFAQDGHQIKAKIKGAPEGSTIYLAHYFGPSQYIKKDSAVVSNGEMTFKGSETLPRGMYLLVLNKDRYYELAINEQQFEIESDTIDFVRNFKTTSKENKEFYELQNYIRGKSEEARLMEQSAQLRNDEISNALNRKKMAVLQNDIDQYKKDFIKKNEGMLIAKFIKATTDVELPKVLPKRPDGRPDSTWLFYQYKKTYFDNIDFSDDAMVRTPFLQKSIDRYMKELTVQTTDSITKEADFILTKAKANKDVFRFALWYITSQYENPKIVGIEGVFIHLSEKYYLSGDATWLDSAAVANLRKRITTIKPLQPGLKFPEFTGYDVNNKPVSVNDSKGKYTFLVFYADDCGHCKDAAPKFAEYYKTAKARGIEIYMIDVKYDEKKWREFVDTYKINDMVNLWDPRVAYNFNDQFDVVTTPTTFLLDKDKKIVAKKLNLEDFDPYIQFWENRQATISGGK